MQIQYLGHSCFKFIGKNNGDTVTVVTDPYGKEYGLRLPSTDADVVTISHQHNDHNNVDGIKGTPYVIETAGEYDVKGIFVQGIDSYHDDSKGKDRGGNIMYRFRVEDLSIVHLGDLGHTLDSAELERLEGTDIVLVPVGGTYTLNAKKAVEVINQIEPRLVIPMHYNVPGLKFKSGNKIDGVEKFIKEMGIKPTEEEKLKITKKDLSAEDIELVIFK